MTEPHQPPNKTTGMIALAMVCLTLILIAWACAWGFK